MTTKRKIEDLEFRCICGAKILPNDATAVTMMNRKDARLTRQHILCERCAYGLMEWLSLRHYVNRRTNLDDYFHDIEEERRRKSIDERISPVLQDAIDQLNSIMERNNMPNIVEEEAHNSNARSQWGFILDSMNAMQTNNNRFRIGETNESDSAGDGES